MNSTNYHHRYVKSHKFLRTFRTNITSHRKPAEVIANLSTFDKCEPQFLDGGTHVFRGSKRELENRTRSGVDADPSDTSCNYRRRSVAMPPSPPSGSVRAWRRAHPRDPAGRRVKVPRECRHVTPARGSSWCTCGPQMSGQGRPRSGPD